MLMWVRDKGRYSLLMEKRVSDSLWQRGVLRALSSVRGRSTPGGGSVEGAAASGGLRLYNCHETTTVP